MTLNYDKPLSNFAFNVNLRRYKKGFPVELDEEEGGEEGEEGEEGDAEEGEEGVHKHKHKHVKVKAHQDGSDGSELEALLKVGRCRLTL